MAAAQLPGLEHDGVDTLCKCKFALSSGGQGRMVEDQTPLNSSTAMGSSGVLFDHCHSPIAKQLSSDAHVRVLSAV